ncbi:MAG TPA: GBS Bsp-like repeat-containing protein, partial [Candidatus Alectryocaccobium stercorigallinarum]|nr:GBS Bsp-like repeat-containing protein [Candidatus Alectryocaccobium stercorigallinarum]
MRLFGNKIRSAAAGFVLTAAMVCTAMPAGVMADEAADTAAAAESSAVSADNAAGTFSVSVSGIQGSAELQEVQVAVWSDEGWQDDIVWYTAEKQDDGTYAASGSIANHGYGTGLYYFDVYKKMSDGEMVYSSGQTASFGVA